MWEKDFFAIISDENNPVFSKVPGSLTVGVTVDNVNVSNQNEDEEVDEVQEQVTKRSKIEKIRKSAKIVKQYECDETKNVSIPQLQRIVLLQQFEINKMKLEREKKLKESMSKNCKEESTQTTEEETGCFILYEQL